MTSTHKVPKKITAILAILFILPALYIYGVWMTVAGDDIAQEQKIEQFTGHFPSFISDNKILSLISIACCIIAMILAAKSFKQPMIFLRITMWLIVMIAFLLLVLNVFQLL